MYKILLLSILVLGSFNSNAETQKCKEKAMGFLHANAIMEPTLRNTKNYKFTYEENKTMVGEGEMVVQENYTFEPSEISWFIVSLIQDNCRLTNIEYGISE